MSSLARLRIKGLGIAAAVFAVDQWVKHLVMYVWQLHSREPMELLPFFDLRYTQNFGVSLGMLTADTTEMRWLLVAMTGLIALVVLVWMMREKKGGDIFALALVCRVAGHSILRGYLDRNDTW